MRKIFRLLLILLWILLVAFLIVSGSKNGWQSATPIIAYNKPQGIFGWLFGILVLLSTIDFVYYHLINLKNMEKKL